MNETTDQGAKPWVARLICCGRDDGSAWFATRGEAEVFRSGYTSAEGHDRAAIISGHLSGQPQDDGAILAEYLEAMRADGLLRGAVEDAIMLAGRVRAEAGAAQRERDGLLARIAAARTEIAAQSAAHHAAKCGSPVSSIVEQVLAEVETHLVDPQYRPGGDARPARAADLGVFEQLTGAPQPAHAAPQRHTGAPGPVETGDETAEGSEAPQGAAGGAPAFPATPEVEYLRGLPGKLAQRPAWLDPQPRQWTTQDVAIYYLDHCGSCRDAEFYGRAWGHGNPHEKHVPIIEDGHGPLAGQPCACKTCARAEPEAIAPEDEGISTADVLAQIAADEATERVPGYHAMRREQHPKGGEG